MRKSLFFGVLTLGALIFASCRTKDKEESVSPAFNRLVATIDSLELRSVSYTSGKSQWSFGEAISVYTTAGRFETFDIIKGEGTGIGTFAGPDDCSASTVAVYPADLVCDYCNDKLTVCYPDTYDFSYSHVICPPMVAKVNVVRMNFHQLGGALLFPFNNVPGEATCMLVSADKAICGSFDVSNWTNPSSGVMTRDGESSVSIRFSRSSGTTERMEFGIPVPYGTYAHIEAQLLDNDGHPIVDSRKEWKNVQVLRGGITRLPGEAIDGSEIFPGNNLIGVFRDSKTGLGIPGVPVSDGYTFVKTDENGVYQMVADSRCRTLQFTLPSNYKVPVESGKPSRPKCWTTVTGLPAVVRTDFTLEPQEVEDELTLVMISDPQCQTTSNVNRWKNETIPDMKKDLASYPSVYAFTLGDIIFDSSNIWDSMDQSMASVQAGEWYIPFFNCIGNHDHEATKTDDYTATAAFVSHFGPTDYSVNRGKVHVIVMDDVMVTTTKSNSSPNGCTWNYNGGFTDDQIKWLREDIENVDNPADKIVMICCHIPFRAGASSGGSSFNKDKHYYDVLQLLQRFKEAHIMIGHTHYMQNYIHTSYNTAGGIPIYEHVHGAACGSWWSCNSNVTGAPNGYGVYCIKGNTMQNWIAKGTITEDSYQLRVYDGNKTYTGSRSYSYTWSAGGKGGSANITATGYAATAGCFVAEVWNSDDTYWTVEMWKDGVKLGNFTRIPNGGCSNIPIVSYYFNELKKNTDTWVNKTASAYWYYKPEGGVAPTSMSGWEVRAIQTIPGSGRKNTYTCNRFTTDNSEF